MRPTLIEPITDRDLLKTVTLHVERIYCLHESGRDYTNERGELAMLVGKPVSRADVMGAFGSVNPETFARQLLLSGVPTDLSEDEMLELFEHICQADASEFQIWFWVQCLTVNTGDDRLSDLIFWPDEYFGDGNVRHIMSPEEMLATSLAAGRKQRARNPIVRRPRK